MLSLMACGASAQETDPAELFSLSFEELLDVQVVTSSRREQTLSRAAGILSVVSREQILAYGAKDLADALELAPGTLTMGTYMFPVNSLMLRGDLPGQYNTHVLFLLDGYPLREAQNGGSDLAFLRAFPIRLIERIEIIRGPGSVQYGSNAFTGVVNIITRKNPPTGQQAHAALGSNGEAGAEFSHAYGSKPWHTSLDVHYYEDDSNWLSAFDETGSSYRRNYFQQNLGLRARVDWRDWQLSYLYAYSDSGHVGTLPIAGLYTEQAHIEAERHWLNLSTRQALFGGELSLGLTYNGLRNDYVNPGPQPSYMDGQDWQWDLSWQTALSIKTSLIVGMDVQHNSGDSAGEHVQTGHVTIVPDYQVHHSRWFAELSHQFNPAFALVAGVQWNKPDRSGGHLSGRMSANYHWQNGAFIKLQYAEAFRAPSLLEQDIALQGVVIGNPDLAPETADTWDLQWGYRSPALFTAFSVFYTRTEDIITRQAQPGQTASYFNFGQQRLKGLEWEVLWQPPDQHMRVDFSWTYQQNSLAGEAGDNASGMPHHLLKLGLSGDWQGKWEWGIHVLHARQWDNHKDALDVNPQNHTLTNLRGRLAYRFNPAWQGWLTVENGLDETWWQPETTRKVVNTQPYYERGRRTMAGVSLKF
ncbi:bifunctional siderophore receptor/adhesin Iha [Bowmanella dokdonensis]